MHKRLRLGTCHRLSSNRVKLGRPRRGSIFYFHIHLYAVYPLVSGLYGHQAYLEPKTGDRSGTGSRGDLWSKLPYTWETRPQYYGQIYKQLLHYHLARVISSVPAGRFGVSARGVASFGQHGQVLRIPPPLLAASAAGIADGETTMTSVSKACLFGGALFAAGMTSTANADFTIGSTVHGNGLVSGPYAYSYTVVPAFSYSSDTGAASGPTSAYAATNGSTVDVTLSATEISGTATELANTGFAYFNFETEFTMSADVPVELAWDIDRSLTPNSFTFRVIDTDSASTIFNLVPGTDPDMGSTTVNLVTGTNYLIEAFYSARPTASSGSLSATVIPAPASAALLTLGGIAAGRRRRA